MAKACSIDGCTRPSRKRTWCETHYGRFKVHGTPHGPGRREQALTCKSEGCENKPVARDLCARHYYAQPEQVAKRRIRAQQPPLTDAAERAQKQLTQYMRRTYPGVYGPRPTCAISGCDSRPSARGWCGAHYQRWRRFGDPLFTPPEMDRHCTIGECQKVSNARGMCSGHYRRWRLYGDPLITKHKPTLAIGGEPTCTIDGCTHRLHAAGLCSLHYLRVRKSGDPSTQFVAAFIRQCATCGSVITRARRGRARKYCGKGCKPSGRISGSVNKRAWVELLGNEDGWVCWLCGAAVDQALYWPNRFAGSVDHVVHVSHGGSDDRSNLRLAHVTCNTSRGNRVAD